MPRRKRRLIRLVVTLLLVWAVAAYFVLPIVWRLATRHHPAVEGMPRITVTGNGIKGDPLNIALVGTEEEVDAAMLTAGWLPADPITLKSSLRIAAGIQGSAVRSTSQGRRMITSSGRQPILPCNRTISLIGGLQCSITIAKVDAVVRTVLRVRHDLAMDRADELAGGEQSQRKDPLAMPGGTNANRLFRVFHSVTLPAGRQTVDGLKAAEARNRGHPDV